MPGQRLTTGRTDLPGLDPDRSLVGRQRLARDLHDRVARPLTLLLLELESFKGEREDPELRRRRVADFQDQVRDALAGMRESLCDLRGQPWLDRGFVMRLRGELETRAARHPDLDIRLAVSPRWPAAISSRTAEHLLQVVLEALHNARLHGLASRVDIALEVAGGTAEVTVGDDGRGFGPPEEPVRPGMGLTGMHERATLLGGRLRLGGRPGGGTRVRLSFPMEVLA
jgi:signal transduction histidine kinase